MINHQVFTYANSYQSRFVNELAEFVHFPTISAQSKHIDDMKECAAWLANHLRYVGLDPVEVIPTQRHPIVYAEWRQTPERPIVLIYGHYDVQPIDPVAEWISPPFRPVVRGDNLYGRGSSDDKGQLFIHVKALECYLRTVGKPPVNVKCLFEGEEEIGSPNLQAFLVRHQRELSADIAVISDMAILAPDRPAITYALRGALGLELTVAGPEHDLHSGIFGGAVHNPLQALCEIIARLHDARGRIAIPGFYDRVRIWSEDERDFMRQNGPADSEILRNAQLGQGWGEAHFSLYERTTIRPSLTVNGIMSGYQGAGPKAVIPARAGAKLNFRLVPDQKPQEIDELFRRYVSRVTPPTVRTMIRTQLAAQPVLIDRNHLATQAAIVAYRRGFGSQPVFLRSGGTIPVVNLLQQALDIPTVLMGFALPDDGMHGPNEKFNLINFINGITTSICFLSEVGSRLQYRHNIMETRLESSVSVDPWGLP